MNSSTKNIMLFAAVGLLFVLEGTTTAWIFSGSWNTSLTILNMGLISAIMALGVNLQWGYAGLFNIGIMGFVALGGLAAVIVGMPPTTEAWAAGGVRVVFALRMGAATIVGAIFAYKRLAPGRSRTLILIAIVVIGFFVYRGIFDPGVQAVEKVPR